VADPIRKRSKPGASSGRNALVLQLAQLAGVLVTTLVIALGYIFSESSVGQGWATVAGFATGPIAYYAVVKLFWRD
jgi:hypothetical protein